MTEIDAKSVAELEFLVAQADKTAIVTHIRPDGDAVGSCVALASFLESRGKSAYIIYPTEIPDSLKFIGEQILPAGIFETSPENCKAILGECDLLFCLDFNRSHRTGDQMGAFLDSLDCPKILIDHHPDPDRNNYKVCLSECEVSSTAELLFWILMKTSAVKSDVNALPYVCRTACLTGMTTDTNNFANSVFPTTFKMASFLLESGVDRDAVIDRLYNCYREERLRLMGRLLSEKMKITDNGIAYIILDAETVRGYDIHEGETEGFVNIPLGIEKVKISVFLKQDTDRFRVSVRSKRGWSAREIAEKYFNGGGHEQASGGRLMIPEHLKDADDAARYMEDFIRSYGKMA